VNTKRYTNFALLDAMAAHIGCTYVSDLKYMDDDQRIRLLYKLERTPPETASLREWNDALTYLTGEAEVHTREDARHRLMDVMRQRAQSEGEQLAGI
jgi:hypothetical protein